MKQNYRIVRCCYNCRRCYEHCSDEGMDDPMSYWCDSWPEEDAEGNQLGDEVAPCGLCDSWEERPEA